MKTLLVLAEHPELVEAIRPGINPEQYRLLHHVSLEAAEPFLVHGLADVCILDVELSNVQGVWVLERLRRRAPKCPVILYTGGAAWEWEEEAYLQGATYVLTKPLRLRMLMALLERLWQAPAVESSAAAAPPPAAERAERPRLWEAPPANPAPTLSVLRDFSGILTHSLNAEGMLRQFLLLLREILSINRAAIFLRQPAAPFGTLSGPENRRLRAASAMGIAPGLLQHFELSFETGIGGHIFRMGRVLRRADDETRHDIEAQKEFELLGAQVAVPVLDRETVLGVAVFDRRITGEPLVNTELDLIFHLLEQLGLAIKNIWLHDQLAHNHEMMADILRELSSACVVVSRDLAILHANKTARRYFGRADRRAAGFDFSHLPPALSTKVYQVLKTGAGMSNFRFEPPDAPGTIFNVSIIPFQRQAEGLPASALLTAEDLTQSEQLRRLEIETANLRLIKNMAERFASEVGNAMVPVSTHQQLLAEKFKDAEFRASLDASLAESVKRVDRLINQMRYLARDQLLGQESFSLASLLDDAYREACKYQPAKPSQLKYEAAAKQVVATGDRAALRHAVSEIMLNALQANPADPRIVIRLASYANGNGNPGLQIEVQDNGGGFTAETAQNALDPFYTSRIVGLGLGLTVARKIIETHQGKLEILPPKPGQPGVVRISLPQQAPPPVQTQS
jgi:signal transduction histidine kinase